MHEPHQRNVIWLSGCGPGSRIDPELDIRLALQRIGDELTELPNPRIAAHVREVARHAVELMRLCPADTVEGAEVRRLVANQLGQVRNALDQLRVSMSAARDDRPGAPAGPAAASTD